MSEKAQQGSEVYEVTDRETRHRAPVLAWNDESLKVKAGVVFQCGARVLDFDGWHRGDINGDAILVIVDRDHGREVGQVPVSVDRGELAVSLFVEEPGSLMISVRLEELPVLWPGPLFVEVSE